MKLKFLLCLIILITANISYSQEEYEYFGGVKLNDTISITYKVVLTEKNGNVKGYSVTDIGGEHETRSNIFGEYDKKTRTLNFRETNIVYTKSPVSQNDFCFINFTTKAFNFGKTKSIKGNFIGLFSDNTECISGELFLKPIEKLEARIEKISKTINKSKRVPDSIKAKFNQLKLLDSLNMNVLKSNQTLSIFSKSNKVNLVIYDGGQEDGDIVTIKVNGKIVLNKYEIKFSKKVVPIQLFNDKTTVSIIANSVGSISTNTAVIELNDGNNNIRALTNLRVGQSTNINILKKNKKL